MQMKMLGACDAFQHGGPLMFFSENTLFDSLSRKRCFNTSLCCFTSTTGSEYGSKSLQHYILIHLKFKNTPHLSSLLISYICKPIFTKFTANMSPTEMDMCPEKILPLPCVRGLKWSLALLCSPLSSLV